MRRFRAVVVAVALFLGAASEGRAVPITVPAGLSPGESYRLAFVTNGSRDATSMNIADYNAYVLAQANLSTELAALGTGWSAIASTSTTSARDNTGTTGSGGVPIFLLDGSKLADDYGDLWDGTLDVAFGIDQFGNAAVSGFAWTGSEANGTSAVKALGTATPNVGGTATTGAGWMIGFTSASNNNTALFGLSDTLVVPIPEPSTALLLGSGLLGLASWRGGRRTRV